MKPPELHDIERLRKRFGLTQEELARKAGISQSLIARVESGMVDPRYSRIAKIFVALDEMKSKGIRADGKGGWNSDRGFDGEGHEGDEKTRCLTVTGL